MLFRKLSLALALASMPAVAFAADITVYRQSGCGCCGAWAKLLEADGHKVSIVDGADMSVIKRTNGVPEGLASCHTALVEGYVIEGHVPVADVDRLLKEKPAVKGLAVPGMPMGSPGMESDDGTKEPYEVTAFGGKDGDTVFARH